MNQQDSTTQSPQSPPPTQPPYVPYTQNITVIQKTTGCCSWRALLIALIIIALLTCPGIILLAAASQ